MIFAIKNINNQQELNDIILFLKSYGCCWKHLSEEEYNLNFYSDLILIVNEKKITHCHLSFFNDSDKFSKDILFDLLEIQKIKRLLENEYSSDNIYFSDFK